jgi:hypothetical protein
VRVVVALVVFAAALPQPSACVLRRSDVGPAFSGRGAPVGSHGYEVVFTRRTGSLQDGPREGQSTATVYRTASAAHTAFVSRRRLPVGYVRLQLGFSVGQEARQWVRQGEAGVGTVLQYLLVWREHDVDASIVITGRVGVVSAADVAPLARRQETRIRAALRLR